MNTFDVILGCFIAFAIYEVLSAEGRLLVLGASAMMAIARVWEWL